MESVTSNVRELQLAYDHRSDSALLVMNDGWSQGLVVREKEAYWLTYRTRHRRHACNVAKRAPTHRAFVYELSYRGDYLHFFDLRLPPNTQIPFKLWHSSLLPAWARFTITFGGRLTGTFDHVNLAAVPYSFIDRSLRLAFIEYLRDDPAPFLEGGGTLQLLAWEFLRIADVDASDIALLFAIASQGTGP